jgi:hypothetical protein
MAILLYQIFIALIVVIVGSSSKIAATITAGFAALWTLTHVFMPWLMVIQFFTIWVAYSVAIGISDPNG